MADAGQGPHKTTKHKQRRSNVDRSAATRSRILDATIRALYELGYGAVTNHIVAELAGVSRGAMMHHFPTRPDLLVATIEYAYGKLSGYRIQKLDKLKPGLPRFRALIDLAFDTAAKPEGIHGQRDTRRLAQRSGHRRGGDACHDPDADDYARFIGRQVRSAGMTPDDELRGLTAVATMAARSLSINKFTHPNQQMSDNVVLVLLNARERIIARQLGEDAAWPPRRSRDGRGQGAAADRRGVTSSSALPPIGPASAERDIPVWGEISTRPCAGNAASGGLTLPRAAWDCMQTRGGTACRDSVKLWPEDSSAACD